MSVWDDPEVNTPNEFVTFANIGDGIIGEILSISKHTFDDGKIAPKLTIRTDEGDEKTLTAGQVQLKAKLVEARPEVGDRIKIVHTQSEKRAGGKTLKHFDVAVQRPGAKAATPPPAASAAEAPF